MLFVDHFALEVESSLPATTPRKAWNTLARIGNLQLKLSPTKANGLMTYRTAEGTCHYFIQRTKSYLFFCRHAK